MKRSVSLHAATLVVVLTAAYLVWTHDRTGTSDGAQPILALRTLDEVSLNSPDRKVRISKRKDLAGKIYHWIATEKLETVYPRAKGRNALGRRSPAGPRPALGAPFRPAPGGRRPMPAAARARVSQPPVTAAKHAARPQPAVSGKAPARPAPTTLDKDPKAAPLPAAPPKVLPAPKGSKSSSTSDRKGASKTGAAPRPTGGASGAKALNAPASSAAAPARATPKPKKITKRSSFVGNQAAEELLRKLARLPVLRKLGRVGDAKLSEFGLTKSQTTLTLVSGGSPRVFVIGDQTHGNRDYYIQDKGDQHVYVMRPRLIEDLRYADFRLIERSLHSFTSKDYDRVTIAGAHTKRTLLQNGRHKPATATWSEDGAGQSTAKESYRAFLQKLSRLRVMEYLEAERPPATLRPIVRVDFRDGGRSLGFLELSKDTQADTAAKPGTPGYFARSEQSRYLVKVSPVLAADIERELEQVLKP